MSPKAIKLMCNKLVGGIGIVNSVGVLVGGVSIRATAFFTDGNLQEELKTTTGNFLKKKLVDGCGVDVLCVR